MYSDFSGVIPSCFSQNPLKRGDKPTLICYSEHILCPDDIMQMPLKIDRPRPI